MTDKGSGITHEALALCRVVFSGGIDHRHVTLADEVVHGNTATGILLRHCDDIADIVSN